MKKKSAFELVKALREEQWCRLRQNGLVDDLSGLFQQQTNELLKLAQTLRPMTAKEQKECYSLVPVGKVKPGTRLRCDDGFTCLKEGAIRTVKRDYDGNLYINCQEKRHLLDGQLDAKGKNYVGFYLADKE